MSEKTVVDVAFDKQDHLDRIKQYLVRDEVLYAVYDCKGSDAGFVGVTDKRIIFYDQGTISKKKSMISIPYHRVIGVASADEGGVFYKSSEVTILTAAGNFSFEFFGEDKAHWIYGHIINKILEQEGATKENS